MAGVFVNPFTDVGFKIIFGQPASKELLITLLNELLAGEHVIEDLSLLDKEDHGENIRHKGIIFDIYCLTSSGEYIIVEMQCKSHVYFLDRTLYYVCRGISRQIGKSLVDTPKPKIFIEELRREDDQLVHEEAEEYAKRQLNELRGSQTSQLLQASKPLKTLKPPYGNEYKLHTVYGIFLMDFKEDGLPPKFRTDTIIADRETGKQVSPHFRQIYLQFPYFKKALTDCKSLYDKLMYTLKHMETWDRMPAALKEQVFAHLEQLASLANLSEEDQIAYDKALDSYLVERAREVTVRQEGVAEGLVKGRQEGRKEGIIEERIRNARNLKALGVSSEIISQSTGLSMEEVDKL